MVTLKNVKPVILALTVSMISAMGLSACGMKHWLGGDPPPAKIVSKADASSQSGGGGDCASWTKIYEGTEEESQATFECWAAKEPDVWKKIRGARPDELSEREIAVILRDGVISFDGGEAARQAWTRRFIALKKLLGFGPTITRARVDRWISWFRAHRADIRSTYTRSFPIGKTHLFAYADLQIAAQTAASFLRELEWNRTSTELAPLIQDAFAIQDKDTLAGLETGLRTLRNALGFICPLPSDPTRLVPDEIADCFERGSAHFKPAARWVEFMVNDKNSVLEPEADKIRRSVGTAAPLIESWFAQPHMNPIDTQLWFDWAKLLGAHPPDDFIDSLKFLRRLGTRTNELAIYPTEMNRVFTLVQDYENLVLDAIPHYSRAFRSHSCQNADAPSWKECILKDLSVREKSSTIDMLLRVKDPRHGAEAVPLSGYVMSTVAFFNAAAGQIIDIFDTDRDGVISVDIGAEDDELVRFITTSIATYQSVSHYMSNVGKRLDGKIIDTLHEEKSLTLSSTWSLTGFAKLVSSANDVLVERTERERNILEKALSNFANIMPKSALFLDRPAVTATLTVLTSLPHYREIALQEILKDPTAVKAAMDGNKVFSRETFRAHIGDMLKRNFPRTYQKCQEFGFGRSCFIAFDEVMPSPDDPRKLITPSDIDVVTLMAIGMEGVFDTCGSKKNGTLSLGVFDGDDELDCGFVRMKDVGIRLMESKIVQVSPRVRTLAEALLTGINSIFVTRTIGKVALIRGTKDQAVLNLPLFWYFGKTATIGSSYGLLSDIVASDRVKEAKSKAK